MHCRARIDNCSVTGFRHDGIHINTSHGLGSSANCWQVQNCFLGRNGRHGMFVSGGEANAGVGIGVQAQTNVRWGIYDNSYLGTTYIGCMTEANGHLVTSGHDPLLTSGGGYRSVNAAARNVLVGCYTEENQISRIIYPTMIVGGNVIGHGIEIDPAYRDPVTIHNEGMARLHDLLLTGPLSTNVIRLATIASGDPRDIPVEGNVVLAAANGLRLELRLPRPSQVQSGHHCTVKKVDDTAFAVDVTPQGDGTTVPLIDGRPSFRLNAPQSHVTLVLAGSDWHVVGPGPGASDLPSR
jgi:hypothetical protein